MKNKKIYLALVLCSLLLIPAKGQELLNYPLDTINGEEVYQYRVEKSIGLYRIGVNFNVSQNDIIRLNPQLRERGLHYDELLFIPTGRPVRPKEAVKEERPQAEEPVKQEEPVVVVEQPVVEQPVTEQPVAEEPVVAADSMMPEIQPVILDSVIDGRRVVEYALMLPFESRQTKRSPSAAHMMEFYQGALLALHDVQNDSLVYRLRVYDVERSERRVKELCDSTELDRVRGVLGLAYSVQIEPMAAWCDAHQVPLLLPFSDNIDLAKHPQVLQFNSTDRQEADSLCQWIAVQGDSLIHCVAIEVREADLSTPIRELRKMMDAKGLKYDKLPMRDLMNDSATYALDIEKENLIIVHSDRAQHVRVLLPHITKLQEAGYRVRLVGQYSWQKEKIAIPQVYTSVFTSDLAREDYETLWRQLYVSEPGGDTPRYDLLGYDLMRALVGWNQGEREYVGLQSIIRWQQTGEGGWQNAEVQIIER